MADFTRLARVHPIYRKYLGDQRGLQPLPADEAAAGLFIPTLQALQANDTGAALRALADAAPAAAARGQAAHHALLRSLALMLGEQPDLATPVLAAARAAHPRHAGLHLMAGRHLIERGEFGAAAEAFADAARADPTCAPALGALGVLRGFAEDWPGAAAPARQARLLGEEFGPGLVRLTDMFARLRAGGSALPDMDLSGFDGAAPDAGFLARLPVVEGDFRAPDPKKPIVFVACDEGYLQRFVAALAYSLDAHGEKLTLHVHCFGRLRFAAEWLEPVMRRTPNLALNITAEDFGGRQGDALGIHCSSLRFVRAWQALCANDAPMLAVDADVLFRQPVSAFPGFTEADADLTLCSEPEASPPWERVIAGALLAQPTQAARDWLGFVAAVIAGNIDGPGAEWFLDQIALSVAAERGLGGVRIRPAGFDVSCDIQHRETAVVWAVTLNKNEQTAFHGFRRELLLRYEPAQARADANPNEIVRSAHGLMILNKHDMYVGPSIKHSGHWCRSELDILGALIRPGDTVLDVGANFGFHSLAFSGLVGPEGRVFAFEPQRLVWQSLVGALALNFIENVHALNVAVGREAGSVAIPPIAYRERNNIGAVSLRPAWGGSSEVSVLPDADAEIVPLIRLDDAGLASCDLIKLDVEGMELAVLEGADGLIERCAPICYVEFHTDREALLRFFEERGYAAYFHDVPGNPNLLCLPPHRQAVPGGFALRRLQSVSREAA
jgi:FkbM family methyltransferase